MKAEEHPHFVRHDKCPQCGYTLNSASAADGEETRPREGDISVCIQCAAVLRFDGALAVHLMDENEVGALDADAYLLVGRVQAAIRQRKRGA